MTRRMEAFPIAKVHECAAWHESASRGFHFLNFSISYLPKSFQHARNFHKFNRFIFALHAIVRMLIASLRMLSVVYIVLIDLWPVV